MTPRCIANSDCDSVDGCLKITVVFAEETAFVETVSATAEVTAIVGSA
jgi:hypothetical protein